MFMAGGHLTCEALATRATADGALRARASNACRTAVGLYAIAAGRTLVKSERRIKRRGFGNWVGVYEGGKEEDQAYSNEGESATHLDESWAIAVKECASIKVKR